MPKPSNSLAAHGSSHTAAMLNQDNLAQHTQHHQELDESRNFVQEFLDTLDPSSAPQSDPGLGLVELTLDIVQKSLSTESKTRGYDSPQRSNIRPAQQQQQQQQTSQHQPQLQHLNQNQQLRQNKYQQLLSQNRGPQQQAHSNSPDKSKRKKVSKKHQESPKLTYHEPQPILQESRKHPVSTTRRKEGNGAVGKDDTRQSKKRKQGVDDVELGVQDLEIRDSHSTNNPTSRNKRKRQTEGASTRSKGPTTTTKGKLAKNRHVQDDQRASNQQDEDRRKDHRRRATLHDLADNRSDNSNEYHPNHNHRHQRQHRHDLALSAIRQNSNSKVKDNAGRKDSNKPRKILTQGSLIMNIAGKTDHLGIFKKGKASKKTTVQRDNGNEFSEDAFLNQRTDSRESRLSGRRHEQVVTSAYFISARQDDDAAASESSSSYGNKSIHKQSKRASTASSAHSPDARPALQKRTVASTHHTNRHARGHQGAPPSHSSANSNQQQQPNRTNTYGPVPIAIHVTTPEPLEDVLDTFLEINKSQAELPPQVNSIEIEQLQQPFPVKHISSAETYVDSYTELQPYGYAAPPWQDPYRIMCDPLQQQYPIYDLPVAVLPATVPEQQLQHVEYYVDKNDTEYDHGLSLDGLPPQPLPPPSSTHFRWRPHRLF
ncbi:hypothetical protein EC957_005964 [Mortierella hygrophila]|uniref:Uncharacterized protein n=1 Tax=Mortierella hygrophila TaxID=979708 RepID=A0A9P6EZN5_9FUNG|nr:hypothetical protein EC957_005964 [Mortierella hygrophila]